MVAENNVDKNFFHGIDVPFVLKAIKSTGVKITADVLEIAQDVVADAIISHDITKNAKLNTWVYTFIRYQLKNYMTLTMGKSARNKKYAPKSICSLDVPLGADDDGVVLHELLASDVDVEKEVERSILHAKLHDAIAKLDERGQFVMRFYLKAKNPPRCGRELGDALAEKGYVAYKDENSNRRSRAQQILQDCIKKLKYQLTAMGIDNAPAIDD